MVTAQVLAKIAVVELKNNGWLEVLKTLVDNVVKPKTEQGVESSLMALGYICEESNAISLRNFSNDILTAVFKGMKNDKNAEVKLAAVSAFYNSLDFFNGNFTKKAERDAIMQVTCSCTQFPLNKVRLGAMQCLVRIVGLYYDYMEEYMQAIFKISEKAIQTDESDVVLQAIEIWSTIAEIEAIITEDIEFSNSKNIPIKRKCGNFVIAAMKAQLATLLLSCMTKQIDDQTDEEWNVSTAGALCLSLITKVIKEAVCDFTLDFISKNIKNTDWHYREAAIIAFSAILNSPSSEKMHHLVDQAIGVIMEQAVKDEVPMVKDSAAFALGCIAEHHVEVITGKHLEPFLQCLFLALQDDPRVASKAAWALCQLGLHVPSLESGFLNKYYSIMVQSLLKTTEREDYAESNLRINTYAALQALINCSDPNLIEFLDVVTVVFMKRLAATLQQGSLTQLEKEETLLVQGLLCGTLQALTHKQPQLGRKYSDDLMKLYLMVLSNSLLDEAFLAIDEILRIMELAFQRYMEHFGPLLLKGIQNYKEEATCITCINLTTDLANVYGKNFKGLCVPFMEILFKHVANDTVSSKMKCSIFECFGAVALAIEGDFDQYVNNVVKALGMTADRISFNADDEDSIIEANITREVILDCFTSLLQGLKNEKPQAFSTYVDNLLKFIKFIGKDPYVDAGVFRNCINVIGDLSNVYGLKIKVFLQADEIVKMVTEALSSQDEETKKAGKYAKSQIERNH